MATKKRKAPKEPKRHKAILESKQTKRERWPWRTYSPFARVRAAHVQ